MCVDIKHIAGMRIADSHDCKNMQNVLQHEGKWFTGKCKRITHLLNDLITEPRKMECFIDSLLDYLNEGSLKMHYLIDVSCKTRYLIT